jgi:hypothetical protein
MNGLLSIEMRYASCVMERKWFNALSAEILDAAIEVHRIMGPGLLESVYQACLVKELRIRDISCQEGVSVLLR